MTSSDPMDSVVAETTSSRLASRRTRPVIAALQVALACSLLGAGGARAQPYVRRLTIPLVLAQDGANGARWTSELVVANGGAHPASVRYRFVAVAGGGSGEVDDTLMPFEQRFEPDAISYLRRLGLSLPADASAGTLTATMRGLTDPNLWSLSARITTPSGTGRAGLALPGFSQGARDSAWLPGLRQDGETRTNLALFHLGNPGDAPLSLEVTLFPASSSGPRSSFVESLLPGEFRQVDGVLGRGELSEGYAKVERISGTADFVAYASIIDRQTNDGALELPQVPDTFVIVPEAVDSPAWRTELVVTNLGPLSSAVNARWMTPAGEVPFEVPVAAGGQLTIPDLGAFVRGQAGILPETVRGPVNLYPDVLFPAQVLAAARVVSRGAAGAYGVNLDGFRRNRGSYGTVRIFGLVQDDERRSSLVLSNWDGFNNGQPVDLLVAVWDSDTGRKASERHVTVAPKSEVAFSSFLASEAPGVRHAWVEVTRTAGDNSFLAFSVLNDGPSPGIGTGDGQILQGSEACGPGPRPSDILVSRTGRSFRADGCFGGPATDETWLLRTSSSIPEMEVLTNPGDKRTARVLSGGYEFVVLQEGNGPGDADGVYEGVTDQGLPVELVVDRGDLTHLKFSWRAEPLGSCPVGGIVDEPAGDGFPVEPGWPFGPASTPSFNTRVSGVLQPDGTMTGTTSTFRCIVGSIPYFGGGTFTARKVSPRTAAGSGG